MALSYFYLKYIQLTNNVKGIPELLQRLIALIGLVAISPLLLLVIFAIKLESKGPVVFRQVRVGAHGRRFHFYKFRSMYLENDPKYITVENLKSDREGTCKKFRNDPRITKIGKIIRKFSIDEIPQLYNVVKGDMLLIGPRPALVNEVEAYDKTAMNRLNIKPGITGLWQVSGRADTTFEKQISLDIQYIQEKSFINDFMILLSTIPAVVTGKGAY